MAISGAIENFFSWQICITIPRNSQQVRNRPDLLSLPTHIEMARVMDTLW